MSASREKKKRQELLSSGAVDPKAARAAEQRAAEKKSNLLYGTIAVVFVVVAIALVVYNSGVIQRRQTAVTIDGESYTVPETSYYYWQSYQNFLNSEMGSLYAALGALNPNVSLKSQSYTEDQTWDDYFKEQAVDTMRFVHAAVAAANQAGLTLDEEDQASLDASISSMKASAAQNGYSYKQYLNAVYGATMTSSIYESCAKDMLLATKYANQYADENFVYSEDEITAYYEENKNSYDLIDGAYVTVSGLPEAKTDADGNAIDATDEEKAAALATAKETADAILAAYQEGEDLESLAERNGASYSTSISASGAVYGEWFYDSARRAGDAAVLENTSGSSYYVAVFNSRQRDETLDYSVRHILVTAESLNLGEGEEATEEQLRAKAQEILDSWDGTEDGFASLANQNSKDPGSNTNGGLYENVAKNTMAPAFQDWCYEPGRQSGDTGIVYDASTGTPRAHVMYFVGYGDTQYWHYACENDMITRDAADWQNSVRDSVTAQMDEKGMNQIG